MTPDEAMSGRWAGTAAERAVLVLQAEVRRLRAYESMNIETKHTRIGNNVDLVTLQDGTPLRQPIRITLGAGGWYLDTAKAESIAEQLTEAVQRAREAMVR